MMPTTRREEGTWSSYATSDTSDSDFNSDRTPRSSKAYPSYSEQFSESTSQLRPTTGQPTVYSLRVDPLPPTPQHHLIPSPTRSEDGIRIMRRTAPPPPPPPPDGVDQEDYVKTLHSKASLEAMQPGLEVDESRNGLQVDESRNGISVNATPSLPAPSGTSQRSGYPNSTTGDETEWEGKLHSPDTPFSVNDTIPLRPMREKTLYPLDEEGRMKKERRICGIRRKRFWWILAVVLAVILGAVGGAVGGILASRNSTNSNTVQVPGGSGGTPNTDLNSEGVRISAGTDVASFFTSDPTKPMVVFLQTAEGGFRNRTFDAGSSKWTTGSEDLFKAKMNTALTFVTWDGNSGREMRLYYLNEDGVLADQTWSPKIGKETFWEEGSLSKAKFSVHPQTQIAALSLSQNTAHYVWFQDEGGKIQQIKNQNGAGWKYDPAYDFPKVEPGSGITAALGAKDGDDWVVIQTRNEWGEAHTVHLSRETKWSAADENYLVPAKTPLRSVTTPKNIYFIFYDQDTELMHYHGYNVMPQLVPCKGCSRNIYPFLDKSNPNIIRVMGYTLATDGQVAELSEISSLNVTES